MFCQISNGFGLFETIGVTKDRFTDYTDIEVSFHDSREIISSSGNNQDPQKRLLLRKISDFLIKYL